jgi:hypothetical protein
MPLTGRGMVVNNGELEKTFDKEANKTLGDYVLQGGVRGRKFVDEIYTAPIDTVYQVEGMELMGKGGPHPMVSVVGRILRTGEVYMKNLVKCWDHKEYSEPAPNSTGTPIEQRNEGPLGQHPNKKDDGFVHPNKKY